MTIPLNLMKHCVYADQVGAGDPGDFPCSAVQLSTNPLARQREQPVDHSMCQVNHASSRLWL